MRLFVLLTSMIVLTGCNFIAQDKCLDAGGAWNEELEACSTEANLEPLAWKMVSQSTESFEYSFPEFTAGPDLVVQSLNQDLPSGIRSFASQADVFALENPDSELSPWTLDIKPLYQFQDEDFSGLVLETYDYTGGAHGNTFYGAINYYHWTATFIRLENLFDEEGYLEVLSDFITQEVGLEKQTRAQNEGVEYDPETDDFLQDGAAPDIKNFKVFSFADGPEGRGLRFYFAPYQLGAYAEGTFEVLVPVGLLKDYVAPNYEGWFSPVD